MEYKLEKGNPNDNSRLESEKATYAFLDSLSIEYERVDHEAAFTIEQCLDIDKALGCKICKNLFLRNSNSSEYYLLLLPGDKPFKTKILSQEIGSTRLSFADESKMMEYLNITPGSVSIMGLIFDKSNKVNLLIDRDVYNEEYLGCHPCINTTSLKIKTSDIISKFIPATKHEYRIVNLKEVEI